MLESKTSVKITFTFMFVVICISCLVGGECAALLKNSNRKNLIICRWYETESVNFSHKMCFKKGQLSKKVSMLKFKAQELKLTLSCDLTRTRVIDHISQ